jgi:signal transduction histidine kinase
MKPFQFFLLALLFIQTITASGQNRTLTQIRRYPSNTLSFENGLLNNATTDIITDVFGFTWVSAKTGLQRFNGYSLETITPVLKKDTITIDYPVYFFGLKNGDIWISCKEGILEYSPKSNSFSLVISCHSPANFNYAIIPLKETQEEIWCMQENGGIVIYNRKGMLIKHHSLIDPAIINEIIISQQSQNTNTITSGYSNIFMYSAVAKSILSINTLHNSKSSIYTGNSVIFGLSCYHDKLYILSDSAVSGVDVNSGKKINSSSITGISKEKMSAGSLAMVDANQLLVSIDSHLYEFDSNCVYHAEITDLNKNPFVGTGYIFKIYPDAFRRIWLLTNNDIKRIQNKEIPFAHFIYPGEKNNFVRALYLDTAKKFVIAGCFNGGIQLYDTLANPLWKQSLKTVDVKDILGIEKLTADEYLIVTFNKGWYLLKLSARQLTPFSMSAANGSIIQPASTNFGNNLKRINDSVIVIATARNIFHCIFYKTKLISATPLLNFENSNTINCFLYATDKTLWTGTKSGLIYRLDERGHLKTIAIPHNYGVRTIAEDVDRHIWVGTDKGLYIYTSDGTPMKNVTRETGLLNDCIYSILAMANAASVFAGTNMGLSYIPLDGTIKNFSKEMGLQENEFNTGSCFQSPGGRFYFGGINGITAFRPGAISANTGNVVLNITRLMVNDSLFNSSAGTWQRDSIFLNYKQDHLGFDFAAMGLLNTNAYVYQYRMSNLENKWQTTYHPNGINYTLQPGNYVLEIKCHPIFNTDAAFYKRFFIIISPPWWQTLWFKITGFLLTVAVITFIIQQYNQRKFKKRILALQMQQEIQSERERISRDLHDNMGAYATAIIANVDQMSENKKMNDPVFKQLKGNAHEIMDNLRDTIWALNKESITIAGLSDHFKTYLQKISSSYPDKKFDVNENIKNDLVLSPAQGLNIFRIMQEAFTNALKHSDCKKVIVSINADKSFLISISDDGKGIQEDRIHSGKGIKNMYSRAKECGWLLKMNTKEGRPDGRGKGTEVILSSENVL